MPRARETMSCLACSRSRHTRAETPAAQYRASECYRSLPKPSWSLSRTGTTPLIVPLGVWVRLVILAVLARPRGHKAGPFQFLLAFRLNSLLSCLLSRTLPWCVMLSARPLGAPGDARCPQCRSPTTSSAQKRFEGQRAEEWAAQRFSGIPRVDSLDADNRALPSKSGQSGYAFVGVFLSGVLNPHFRMRRHLGDL